MGVYLYKRLKIELESGLTYVLGYERKDGLRSITVEGDQKDDPLPFTICTLEGCAEITEWKSKNGSINASMHSSTPVVGKILVLRPDKPFYREGFMIDMIFSKTPIVKIENI